MSLEVAHHAPIAKAPADIEPDEVVAFGGRLGLAFKSADAHYAWSHLIDLASFEAVTADEAEKLPAGVVSLGSAWAISFGPIGTIADPAACAAGSLIIDPMGTWLVAGSAERGDLARFGLVGACLGQRVGMSDAIGPSAFRVPRWRMTRAAQIEARAEPFVLELGENDGGARGRRRSHV